MQFLKIYTSLPLFCKILLLPRVLQHSLKVCEKIFEFKLFKFICTAADIKVVNLCCEPQTKFVKRVPTIIYEYIIAHRSK